MARVHSDFSAAFSQGKTFVRRTGGRVTASVHDAGGIFLPTGAIAFGQPRVPEEMRVLAVRVSSGRYPLELSVATDEQGHAEPACARIRFSEIPAVRWVLAVTEGEDVEELGECEYFGTPIGVMAQGAFVDEEVRAELMREEDRGPPPDAIASDAEKLLLWTFRAEPRRPAIDALEARLATWGTGPWDARSVALPSGGEVGAFSTPGPGTFAAYWGYAESGDVAELVVDLNGFLENDTRELVLDVGGSAVGPLLLPELPRPVGEVSIVARKPRLVVTVASSSGSQLELVGYESRHEDSVLGVVRYELDGNVQAVRALAHFGLRRMKAEAK